MHSAAFDLRKTRSKKLNPPRETTQRKESRIERETPREKARELEFENF